MVKPKYFLFAGAGLILLSLLSGLWVSVRQSIRWRAEAQLALTREKERYSQQERTFVARLQSVADSADMLRSQASKAELRANRATGQLTHLRDSLRAAVTCDDSLQVAVQVIETQDTVIASLSDEVSAYRLSDQVQRAGLLLAAARADTLNTRIASLEGQLRSAPLLQPVPQRKFLGVFKHPGDGWVILGTAVVTLVVRSQIK